MKTTLTVILLILLTGCTTPKHQEGGYSTLRLGQEVTQGMRQPQNPEGPSRQAWEEVRTIHHNDGSVEVFRRAATTDIGGSQDLAKIIKAYANLDLIQKSGMALILALFAWMAWRRQWPILALACLTGSFVSILTPFYWLGAFVALIGVGVYYGTKLRVTI